MAIGTSLITPIREPGNRTWTFYIYTYLFIYGYAGFSLLCAGFVWCGERGILFVAVHKRLTAAASLAAEHRL